MTKDTPTGLTEAEVRVRLRRIDNPTSEQSLCASHDWLQSNAEHIARALLDAWAERDALIAVPMGKTFTVDEAQEEIARVKADAEAAVALALEAAAKLCDQYVTPFGRAGSAPDAVEGAVHGLAPVIRALAPASGLAAVQELRAERNAWRENYRVVSQSRTAIRAERDTLAAELAASRAREKGLREALDLAIGLGRDLGMTDMEEGVIRDRAALAQPSTEGGK